MAEKYLSVYWFLILFIVAGGIAYSVALIYGAPYDVREIEQDILTNKVADCLIEKNYLKEAFLLDLDSKEFLEVCGLNFNVEDEYGWSNEMHQGEYYVQVIIYDFDKISENLQRNQISEFLIGNRDLEMVPNLKGSSRIFYVLDRNENKYVVEILTIVRKTEKNVR